MSDPKNAMQQVDEYIISLFAKILFRGTPVPLYPFIAIGTEGVRYPHIACVLHNIKEQERDSRPDHILFWPSEGETTVSVPLEMGGGIETGPISYTKKMFPMPYTMLYEMQIGAQDPAHFNRLMWELMQAFPQRHTPKIGDLRPVFALGRGINLDENDSKLFAWSFLMNVYDVWVDRREAETYQSIRSILFDQGTTT